MFKRTVRWIKAPFTALGILVAILVTTPLSEYLAQPLRLEGQLRNAQAIVVLGGGAFTDALFQSHHWHGPSTVSLYSGQDTHLESC